MTSILQLSYFSLEANISVTQRAIAEHMGCSMDLLFHLAQDTDILDISNEKYCLRHPREASQVLLLILWWWSIQGSFPFPTSSDNNFPILWELPPPHPLVCLLEPSVETPYLLAKGRFHQPLDESAEAVSFPLSITETSSRDSTCVNLDPSSPESTYKVINGLI